MGGIFRHVRDLINEQVAAGHQIGVICDNNTGGDFEEQMLAELQPKLGLGLHRLSMDRSIGPKDAVVAWKLYRNVRELNLDVLHSHGAKGGAYARIIGTLLRMRAKRPVRLYCPHGGSIHYDRNSLAGRVFFGLERVMERFTDRLIFVSKYERDGYIEKVGNPPCPYSLVFNGLTEPEFEPVCPAADASDFLYIGMMRDLKGVDVFLDALPLVVQRTGRNATATLIGDGPDLSAYVKRDSANAEGIRTIFLPPMDVRKAFSHGRIMVVPSRAESMPYIVLEALAAQVPLIATNVGGIPEIYGEHAGALVEPDSIQALAERMAGVLQETTALPGVEKLANRINRNFSAKTMANSVMEAYRAALSTN
ncbi:MAG: glycosyltransferase [Rhizobiaceae bacterium]